VGFVHTSAHVLRQDVAERTMARQRIGELLVERGHIDPVQLRSALAYQRRWGGRLGRSIVDLGFMPERALLEQVGAQLGVPVVDLAEWDVPAELLAILPERLMRERKALPLERRADHRRGPLVVALADPGDLGVLDEISFASGLEVSPVLAAEADLDRALARLLDGILRRNLHPGSREDAIDLPPDTGPLGGRRFRQ
jgi:type IV pilus assembly protein PilB